MLYIGTPLFIKQLIIYRVIANWASGLNKAVVFDAQFVNHKIGHTARSYIENFLCCDNYTVSVSSVFFPNQFHRRRNSTHLLFTQLRCTSQVPRAKIMFFSPPGTLLLLSRSLSARLHTGPKHILWLNDTIVSAPSARLPHSNGNDQLPIICRLKFFPNSWAGRRTMGHQIFGALFTHTHAYAFWWWGNFYVYAELSTL